MDILFIEDEKEFAQSLQKLLEFHHHGVDLVYTGEQGWKKTKSKKYDVIILDIMLPGIDGFRLAQKIRQEGISTPIIMLTARDAVGDRVKGLDSGADDYLIKPFEFEELLARLRSIMRRQPQALTSAVLRIADLELDSLKYKVKRGSLVLELNNKEYEILHYLLDHLGDVITREELWKHVWGKKKLKSNTIDVHIQSLRNKIDQGQKVKLLHTIRGRGYKIDHQT